MNDFWFALAITLMYFFSVTDAVSTMVGLSDGLVEGNPIWEKVFGKKISDFALKTAGGVFASCVAALGLSVGFYKVAEALDHNHNADSWLPFTIAAGFLTMTVRNTIMIYRKK